jgi:hypothetical protein
MQGVRGLHSFSKISGFVLSGVIPKKVGLAKDKRFAMTWMAASF